MLDVGHEREVLADDAAFANDELVCRVEKLPTEFTMVGMRRGSFSQSRPMDDSEEDRLLEELEGAIDMRLKADVWMLCRRLLARPRLSPDGLSAVVRAIGMFGTLRSWAAKLEAMYSRQPAKLRRVLSGTMLIFYGGFNDWPNAARFAAVRRDWQPNEAAFAMEALLRAGRMKEAERLCRICHRRAGEVYEQIPDDQEMGDALQESLGWFTHACALRRAWQGEHADATDYWEFVPEGHSMEMAALFYRLDAQLGKMWRILEEGAHALHRMVGDDPTMLALPGNHDDLTKQHRRMLSRYRRALERLLPTERRKEFGLDKKESE
jgi:hypothetical protein